MSDRRQELYSLSNTRNDVEELALYFARMRNESVSKPLREAALKIDEAIKEFKNA